MDIKDFITKRRKQLLVHSLLYYALDVTLVTDDQWTSWAKELATIQKQNPEIAGQCVYAAAFEGFEGASGFNLPYVDEEIVMIARDLLVQQRDFEGLDRLERVVQIKYSDEEYRKAKKKEEKKVAKKHKGLFF